MNGITIEPGYDDLDTIRQLFTEYAGELGIDLAFQGFAEELASLPGKYALPDGRLYIARVDGKPAGCVALRRFDRNRCEMKRLYVRGNFRSFGVGRRLAERIINEGAAMGYGSMLLDTLERLGPALNVYERMGFVRIEPYCHNPQPDVVFMEKAYSPLTGS